MFELDIPKWAVVAFILIQAAAFAAGLGAILRFIVEKYRKYIHHKYMKRILDDNRQ